MRHVRRFARGFGYTAAALGTVAAAAGVLMGIVAALEFAPWLVATTLIVGGVYVVGLGVEK